jgi:NAD(P)-dependent dehydrogenase (short-subunit alcohol dehydrogenase family)
MDTARERVVAITGASSGIGLVAAKALASLGWRVIAVGRNPDRSAVAADEIKAASPDPGKVTMLLADLSLVSEARRLASQVLGLTDRLDVLVNNAGGVAAGQHMTAEGNEATFAGNHLGHFVLTDQLLPLLQATAGSPDRGPTRIINTASSAHEATPGLDWDDLQSIRDFNPNRAYCNAKLANVLYTRALARRLEGTGIAVHAVHPGAVDTRFFSRGNAFMQEFGRARELVSAEDGADTLIWLATSDEIDGSTGEYFYQRRPIPVSPFAADDGNAERLWRKSEQLVAVGARQ